MIMQSKTWNNISMNKNKSQLLVTSFANKNNEIKDGLHHLKNSETFNSILTSDDHDSEDDDLTTPWICWSCSRVFQFKCLLFKHQLYCIASYKRKQTTQKQRRKALFKEILSSMKQKIITCPICQKDFTSKPQYQLHQQQGSCGKKRLACIECHQKFKSLLELQVHNCHTLKHPLPPTTHSPKRNQPKVFTCKCCESTFNAPELLKNHLLQNSACSKMHHLHIKMEYKKRQLESKHSLTARKSLTNSTKSSEENTSSSFEMYSIDLNSSPVTGSARKSFSSSFHKMQDMLSKSSPSPSHSKFQEEYSQSKSKQVLNQCPECQETYSNTHELSQHQADFDHYSQGSKCQSFSCKCPFCDKKFLHIQNRNAHLRYHTEKTSSDIKEYVRKTTCGVCFRTFGNESTKEDHIRSAHIQMAISSPTVKGFESSQSSSFLQNSQNSDNSPKLVVLSRITDTILKKLRNVPNVCPVCRRTYDSNAIRNRHFRLHVMGASCECEVCFLKFPLTSYLETHMKNEHKNNVMYNCKNCGISFVTRIAILQHVMKNHPLYSMTDLIEEKHSSSKVLNFNNLPLKNEVKSEDVGTKEEFHCTLCNLKFLKLCGLRRHQTSKVHLKVMEMHKARQEKVRNLQLQLPPRATTPPFVDYSQPITCTQCAKEFRKVQHFVPHRLSHFSGENEITESDVFYPYTCEVCGKLLDSQQKIQVHLMWHLQDLQSQMANKSFKARKSLPSKTSTFSVSVPSSKVINVGAIAKKSFRNNSQQELNSSKKLPFSCIKCSTNFSTKRDYILHVKQMHTAVQSISEDSSASENFAVNCVKCDKFFDEKSLFYSHQKSCNVDSLKSYCVTCGCFFSVPALFDEHKIIFCTSDFKANVDENFISKNLDVLKNSIKTDVTIISCIQCCLMFNSIEMLAQHMDKHKVKITTNGSISSSMEASYESDSDYASSSHKESKLNFWKNEKPSLKVEENEDSQLCKISNINTIDPNLFAMDSSQDSYNLPSDEDGNICDENSSSELMELRQNFSHLLSALVSDADLMQNLGFGERLIDEVLVSVLEKMALTPVNQTDDSLSELDKLRCNIRTLLDVCIKDQIMEFITDNEITTDKIVVAALKMFGVHSE